MEANNVETKEQPICQLTKSHSFSDESIKQERKHNKKESSSLLLDWFRWNGVYLYAYGCSLAGILCAVASPLLNMYQGGNLFPYVSEVIRGGFVKVLFFLGSFVGFIPTLFFATNYLRVALHYSVFIQNACKRHVYRNSQYLLYVLFLYSAVSVIGVSLFDMDTSMDFHSFFSSTWVLFTNVMEAIQLVSVKWTLYQKTKEPWYITEKALILLFSIAGMLVFVLLGMYVPCHSYTMTMDQCLLEFPEAYCFSIQRKEPDYRSFVTLRQYSHCGTLHFCRGLGEFVAVISTMYYLTTIVYDVKKLQQEINRKAEKDAGTSICIGLSEDE